MIELLQPIVNRLREVFGDKIPIYTERQEQGVETPCFFIKVIDTEIARQFNDFFFLYNIVNIVYMSDTDDAFHLEEMKFRMLTELEQVRLKRIGVTGKNLNAKIRDKDIIMTVDYDIWMEKVKVPDPLMKILKQKGQVKE